MERNTTYNNERRFMVTNWSAEDLSYSWDGVVSTIKSGESVELPMYLAYHATKHLIDREMMRQGKVALEGDEERLNYEKKTISEITNLNTGVPEDLVKKIEGSTITQEEVVSKTTENNEFADLKEEVKEEPKKKVSKKK